MPLAEATVQFDISDKVGVDFDHRRTKVYVTTNVEVIHDETGHKTRVGSGRGTINADGTGSVTVWVPGAGSNPASWQTTIHVDYPDRDSKAGRKVLHFGPYTITGDTWLDALEDEQDVPPTYLTTVTAQLDGYVDQAEVARDQAVSAAGTAAVDAAALAAAAVADETAADATAADLARVAAEAARDDAVDISGISTSDGVVEALVKNTGGAGPLTSAALAATYAPIASPTFTGPGVKMNGLAIGGAVKGQKRTPFIGKVVIDGTTLGNEATDGTHKIGQTNVVTFTGGFTAEASRGVADPTFAWGANDFVITGTNAGDIAGLTNLWGRLSEVHLRSPGTTITDVFGLVGQANVAPEGTGTTVTGWLASLVATGPINHPGATVANAASLYVTSPAAGAGTNRYAIYQGGDAPSRFNGQFTLNAGAVIGGGAGTFRVTGAPPPNTQAAAAGVYAGYGASTPAVELATGTSNFRIDNTAGVLRFLKAGTAVLATLNDAGDFSAHRSLIMGNGTGRIATNATDGFLYARAMAGAPTATPTAVVGSVPMVIDDTNSKLYARIGGVWKSVTFA